MMLSIIGKFFISCSLGLIYLYTSEMFPTSTRSAALGMCATMSKFGSIAAPALAEVVSHLGILAFSFLHIPLGLSIVCFVPKTNSHEACDTSKLYAWLYVFHLTGKKFESYHAIHHICNCEYIRWFALSNATWNSQSTVTIHDQRSRRYWKVRTPTASKLH